KNFSSIIAYKPNNISVEKLNIDIPSYNIELKNTSLNADFWGSINNLQELKMNLKSYHIETKGSTVSGSAKVKNLDNPDYEFESKIVTNLAEAKEMLPDSLLKTLSGNVELNVRSKATLKMDSLEFQMMEIVFKNSSYTMTMNNVSAELFDMPLYTLENVSGLIDVTPEAITINKMSGIAAGMDFEIDSTEIWNTYETFIQDRKDKIFTLQTNVILGEINNALLGAFMSDTTATSPPASNTVADNTEQNTGAEVSDSVKSNYLLPDLSKLGIPHFLVRGKLAIKKLEYEKNIVDDFSMKFRFADSLYVVDELTFKTCGGELNTSFMLDARKWEEPKIDVKNYITNLNVKELLMRNDNFGDTSLTYEKVNGILTSEIHARAFYENGSWPTERVRAEGHFTLEDGHIYGYEPLVELSKNKIIGGLKELDKLDFNTLKTSIFVFKDKIFIPKTNVVTSSMDMSAFAMHDLKGDYEYHIKIHLGDVLTGKSEKIMKEQAKQNKKDGTPVERNGIKLVSMKKDGNKKNGFDNEKLEKAFLNDLNKRRGFLNLSFRPLLVNFSTDLDRTSKFKDILEDKQEE
ncbi:MAG TPA: AsmA-like C-terminal region-containing protein, partial [Bacteroidales bacterium]|nr:AsmA-like C-terminal region-containing protein [Bacteroidales bacterium]